MDNSLYISEMENLNMDMTKEEIQRIVMLAIKTFLVAHPDGLERDLMQSLAKRIAGQVHTHFIHNPNENGGG